MTPDQDIERVVSRWLTEGPTQMPSRFLQDTLDRIDRAPQPRLARLRTRLPAMFPAFRLAATVAIALMVSVTTVLIFGGLIGPGGEPAQLLASPSPSEAASPSPSSDGTVAFTSPRHGYRIRYPGTWTVTPATAPWPQGTAAASPPDPMLDVFVDPASSDTFVVVSQPLPSSTTPDAWLAAYEASAPSMPPVCWPAPDKMEKTSIDGQPAYIHGVRGIAGGAAGCEFTEAVTFAGGRVYEFTVYFTTTAFDRGAFDALLASVTLDPSSADDSAAMPSSEPVSPSGSIAPSPAVASASA
jgi:hypothetical protein